MTVDSLGSAHESVINGLCSGNGAGDSVTPFTVLFP